MFTAIVKPSPGKRAIKETNRLLAVCFVVCLTQKEKLDKIVLFLKSISMELEYRLFVIYGGVV